MASERLHYSLQEWENKTTQRKSVQPFGKMAGYLLTYYQDLLHVESSGHNRLETEHLAPCGFLK